MTTDCEIKVWEKPDSIPATLRCRDVMATVRIAGSLARTGDFHRVMAAQETKGITGRQMHVLLCFDASTSTLNPGEYVPALNRPGVPPGALDPVKESK